LPRSTTPSRSETTEPERSEIVKAEFEEKTFEVAANNEFSLLGAGYTCPGCGTHHCVLCGMAHPAAAVDIWAPGQVLEGVLGFDVLVQLDGNANDVAALVGVTVPAGMHWKQHFGDPVGAGSAPDWASLFIQYKRPDRLVRRRGEFLQLFTGPYFRFDLDPHQHASLAGLRAAANGQAVVCYASPRFHTNADLLHYRQSRLVLERTAFIEASDDDDHTYGAYDETTAFLCSEPARAVAHSLPSLLAVIRRLDLPHSNTSVAALQAHLDVIAAAIDAVRGVTVGLQEPDARELESQVHSVLSFAVENEAVWLLAAVAR
jgi:hypothetical protein